MRNIESNHIEWNQSINHLFAICK